MATSMPVQIPRGRRHLEVPPLDTRMRQHSSWTSSPISGTSSRQSVDELFFECQTSSASGSRSEAPERSNIVSEPAARSVSDNENVDYRRYEPPAELLQSQAQTSEIIHGLLSPSIDRIRERHVEEDAEKMAAAKQKAIHRSRRASLKPTREISITMHGALVPLQQDRSGQTSGASTLSANSFLSASSLMSPDSDHSPIIIEELKSSKSAGKKHSGLRSLFGRKAKPAFSFAGIEPPPLLGEVPEPADIGVAITTPGIDPVIVEDFEEQPSTIECVSCLDDFNPIEMVKLTCHSYCEQCFMRLINTSLESETHWPPKCCLNTIPGTSILPHIDVFAKDKYKLREAEWSIQPGNRVYCSHAGCNAWIAPEHISPNRRGKCQKCGHKTCAICRGVWHNKQECPQDPALIATISLAEQEGWRRCFQCHAMVEHNQGCRHMTCRCRAQFCYICGLKWRTCACTDAQLARIQLQAATRREQTAAETAAAEAAAEEERIILQMVEEFEAAEAVRLAREAEEQRLRDEEEQRQRDAERLRVEEERIAAVSQQFLNLTAELDVLHDIQRIQMAERYEIEQKELEMITRDELELLSSSQAEEKHALSEKSRTIISTSEAGFLLEYTTRLAEEQRIEAEYVDQLREYYKGNRESEFRIREARDELRQDQNKEYHFWNAYRKKQLTAILDTELHKAEMMSVRHASELNLAECRGKINVDEWMRKKKAEGMWVDEVVRERVAMLQAFEQTEYAGN